MVLRVEHVTVEANLLADQLTHPELLFEPQRHRLEKRRQAGGGERQVGLEQALELEPGLVVEGDVIDLGRRGGAFVQAVVDRVAGEAKVVLLAAEALFLGGGDDLAVADEAGRGVVVEGGRAL
jgi:hypothetical protein